MLACQQRRDADSPPHSIPKLGRESNSSHTLCSPPFLVPQFLWRSHPFSHLPKIQLRSLGSTRVTIIGVRTCLAIVCLIRHVYVVNVSICLIGIYCVDGKMWEHVQNLSIISVLILWKLVRPTNGMVPKDLKSGGKVGGNWRLCNSGRHSRQNHSNIDDDNNCSTPAKPNSLRMSQNISGTSLIVTSPPRNRFQLQLNSCSPVL